MADAAANAEQIERMKGDLDKLNKFMKEMESLGFRTPALKKAVGKLTKAIEMGQDIAAAAKETSLALDLYTKSLEEMCEDPTQHTHGDEYVCKAAVARQWQARNVRWTLSWEQENSVVRNSARNILCRYMPKTISKRLDYCAKSPALKN